MEKLGINETESRIQNPEQEPPKSLFQRTLFPFFLILTFPPFALVIWYTHTQLGGSLGKLWELIVSKGFFTVIWTDIWQPVFFGSSAAWSILLVFSVIQLLFMKFLPGKPFDGPKTPNGNTPKYKANGLTAFLLTLFLFYLSSYGLGLFSASILYDYFGEILGALNLTALIFCLFLYFKGKHFPSSSDSGTTGNFIFDYYWGTELYPRIQNWDVKMFTNCRFGMMIWALLLVSFAEAQRQQPHGLTDAMIVAVILQLIYITKFFIWEPGYMKTLDIMYDRAGFYICWGCLVWLPSIYTSSTLYLVNQPHELGLPLTLSLLVLGTVCILANYFSDRQKELTRSSNGTVKIWGKPPHLIQVSYTDEHGKKQNNLLLASGFWGIARHFNYTLEILAAFFWTLPVLFSNSLPYFYVVFLIILLVHRSQRDQERCQEKYKEDWNKYCQTVPYKFIPKIF